MATSALRSAESRVRARWASASTSPSAAAAASCSAPSTLLRATARSARAHGQCTRSSIALPAALCPMARARTRGSSRALNAFASRCLTSTGPALSYGRLRRENGNTSRLLLNLTIHDSTIQNSRFGFAIRIRDSRFGFGIRDWEGLRTREVK